MNRGILHTALTGKLQLELQYREPLSKKTSEVDEELSVVDLPRGTDLQPQTAEEFSSRVHVI